LTQFFQVNNQRFIVFFKNLCADWYLQDDIFTGCTITVASHPVIAGFTLEMLLVAIVNQRVQPLNRFDPYITALASVTSIWATKSNVFFTTERNSARSPISRSDIHSSLIEKLHMSYLPMRSKL